MGMVKNGGLSLFHGSFAAPPSIPSRRKLYLLAQAAPPSRTQRIMESIPVSGEVGGAGGAYSYNALKRLDGLWSSICNSSPVVQEPPHVVSKFPGLFQESERVERCTDMFDVIVCGGTLGIFVATALSSKGLRVGIVEKSILRGNRCGFEGKGDIWVNDILNLGVSPAKLIETMRTRFTFLGGIIFEGCSVSHISIYEDSAVLELADGKILSSRLIIDAMGNFSPIVKQIRRGRKPDGICVVVGSCCRGFTENSTSDVIYSSASVKRVGIPCWLWSLDRTTYMFTYLYPEPGCPLLEELLEDYWELMPKYQLLDIMSLDETSQGVSLDDLEFGDASGIQSPVSFGGFGSLTRHLGRLSAGIHEAINSNFLDAQSLSLLNPYMVGLLVLLDWSGHFMMLGYYTFLSSYLDPVIRPLVEKFPGKMKYEWKQKLEAWKYGAGLDYELSSSGGKSAAED
ncbi:UNVERIFIED_CONTAM: hypothetical protein Sangu_2420200 [Sesamum angustifolium]|uniref:Lycopene beta-cyclase n=1 Tax=Sesamum angustifolium TaxID=2727405 RepID=A0AAW2KWE1_9LAMI